MTNNPTHICIGLARSGTTWLFEALSKSNVLFLPPAKEVRYWYGAPMAPARRAHTDYLERTKGLSDEDRTWLEAWISANTDSVSGKDYSELMDRRGIPTLDISPSYAAMPSARIQQLKEEISEDSKVFILLRHPYDRLRSEIKLHGFLHGKFRGPATNAIVEDFLSTPRFQANHNYAAIVSRWKEVFGDRFNVFYYEDMISNQISFIESIIEYLDIENFEMSEIGREGLENFVATERNNPQGDIYPRLTRHQDRIIAEFVKKHIEDFAEISPERSESWMKMLLKKADSLPPLLDLGDKSDLDYQKLLRMTESIGDNCEFGFVQRFEKYEPSSLFRWAFAPTDSMVNYLESPQPLFEKDSLKLVESDLIFDSRSGINFHSDLIKGAGRDRKLVDASEFDDIWKKEKEKIDHFAFKFWHFLSSRPGIYVLKNNSGLSEEQIERTESFLLSKHPNHKLLAVRLGAEAKVESYEGSRITATIPRFADYSAANDIDLESWRTILCQILEIDDIKRMVDSIFV